MIYTAKTIGWQGSDASNLNDVIQDPLLSCWDHNRKVRISLDLPDLCNDACTLIEQYYDLLIDAVYLLSTGRKSNFGI